MRISPAHDLGRADVASSLTFVAEPRKIPVILSPEEVAQVKSKLSLSLSVALIALAVTHMRSV
jgi:hypothetical protein